MIKKCINEIDYDKNSSLVLYKTCGDYYRYIVETLPYDPEIGTYREGALECYSKAEDICNENESIDILDKIVFYVNYTIFLRGITVESANAVFKAKSFFRKLETMEIDNNNLKIQKYKRILKENIDIWDHEDTGIDSSRKTESCSRIPPDTL